MLPLTNLGASEYGMRMPQSPELRAYLRNEWGSDAGWFYASARRSARSPWERLRGWMRLRARRRRARTRAPSVGVAPLSTDAQAIGGPEACTHLVSEELGAAGNARFLSCTLCGAVLVLQGGAQWRIGAAPAAPASPVTAPVQTDSSNLVAGASPLD